MIFPKTDVLNSTIRQAVIQHDRTQIKVFAGIYIDTAFGEVNFTRVFVSSIPFLKFPSQTLLFSLYTG